jgi:hypothetical protein
MAQLNLIYAHAEDAVCTPADPQNHPHYGQIVPPVVLPLNNHRVCDEQARYSEGSI